MIKIEDDDSPMKTACKIVYGIKPTGQDMFDLNELKEIANYLLVYYNSHIPPKKDE